MDWNQYAVGTIVIREDEDGAEIVCEIAVDEDGDHYPRPLSEATDDDVDEDE